MGWFGWVGGLNYLKRRFSWGSELRRTYGLNPSIDWVGNRDGNEPG